MFDALLTPDDGAAVEVDHVGHPGLQGGIGRDFHNGTNGIPRGGAEARGEEDQVGTRPRHTRGGLHIVAWRTKQIKPLLIWVWKGLKRFAPAPLTKIALGAAIASVASLLLAAGAAQSAGHQASWLWPVLAFCAFGVGYMHYWPTCLALIAQSAPAHMKATMISVSFLGFFVANLLVGYIGTYYEPLGPLTFWIFNASIAATGSLLALLARGRLTKTLNKSST